MAKAVTLTSIFSVLLLSSISLELSAAARLPVFDAERLTRSLNLVPEEAKADPGRVDDMPAGQRIVERSFVFPGLSVNRSSVKDLGHHAGYYKLAHTHAARMFYFFFESRNKKKKDPVVIWLTGGPGCSSELALFYENGPFKIANNLSLTWNKLGWDQVSNLIYVDQPTGTGFSYSPDKGDIRHDEKGVSNDLYDFLQAFFATHPEYVHNDFYITGESYAGHYIPAFASRVHQGNKAREGIHINLKGFAIGNGLTDPAIQYRAYGDFALQNKLINQSDYEQVNKFLPKCEEAITRCATSGPETCSTLWFHCSVIYGYIMQMTGGINEYDIRKKCDPRTGSMCYDFSNMEKFLNQKPVRDALGVGNVEFVSCSKSVYEAMLGDWLVDLEVGIPALLEDGIKMLVYAGENDFICNWLGNWRWAHAMNWTGQHNFGSAPEKPFIVDGVKAGMKKNHGPLSFLKVHEAGHMVPMDQPKAALAMLKRWTTNKLFHK